ncbi:hypothetical protein PF008_g18087 [Phytophthora fragariae]|uniref:Uncharacterized protein n=1 Tax=Phytophthora fragariae TaxID=53985 RepID=A0A6G0R6C5_9STRA|nr:hypothetical protein PF003_g7798 [Phytophthora fragariae]KAE9320172.1 hypothetical protein PF008_g18087 [Phytophthora fragariae]
MTGGKSHSHSITRGSLFWRPRASSDYSLADAGSSICESSYTLDSDDDDNTSAVDVVDKSNEYSRIDVATVDAKCVDESDDPQAYTVLEPDAENNRDDENDVLEDDFIELDVQLLAPQELRFDVNLVDAVSGMENIESGTVSTDLLRNMGEKGWSYLSTSTPYDYLMQSYEGHPATR